MRRNAWYFSVLWTSAIGLMLLTTSASAQTITTSQVPGASHTTAADINDAGSITLTNMRRRKTVRLETVRATHVVVWSARSG